MIVKVKIYVSKRDELLSKQLRAYRTNLVDKSQVWNNHQKNT